MIYINIDWNEFKRVIFEGETGHIYLDIEKHEDGLAKYTFAAMVNKMPVICEHFIEGVEDQVMFEESFLKGRNIVVGKINLDKDINLVFRKE